MSNKPLASLVFSGIIIALFTLPSQSKSSWQPPDSLAGTWSAKSEVFADFKKGKYPSEYPEDLIDITIQINRDATVDGKVGDATLKDCWIKKNRSWFGRWLNIKTDFIICKGTIDGKVVPEDKLTSRRFTIPFNIVDGKMRGSIMLLYKWKYPYPMFPRMMLKKEPNAEK
jgi:hypothetical protein